MTQKQRGSEEGREAGGAQTGEEATKAPRSRLRKIAEPFPSELSDTDDWWRRGGGTLGACRRPTAGSR